MTPTTAPPDLDPELERDTHPAPTLHVQRIALTLLTLTQTHARWVDCQRIRRQVFVEEQHVPEALEWDSADATATHLLACIDGQPVGCARVLPEAHIGRMAVLPAWRGQGIGEALLMQAIQCCRQQGATQVALSAQTHAVGFYAQVGFVVCSAPYLDAGIPHVDMQLELV